MFKKIFFFKFFATDAHVLQNYLSIYFINIFSGLN